MNLLSLSDGSQKYLIVGDDQVGKTDMIRALASFSQNNASVESDNTWFEIHDVSQHRPVSVGLGGQARAHFWECSMNMLQSQKAADVLDSTACVIITYNTCNYDSFVSASTTWISMVRTRLPSSTFVCLVGCKMDDVPHRRVTIEEAQLLASRENMLFMEISAHKGTNVQRTLMLLASSATLSQLPESKPTRKQVVEEEQTVSAALGNLQVDVAGSPPPPQQHAPHAPRAPHAQMHPAPVRMFSQPAQVSTSYDSINAILGRSTLKQEGEYEAPTQQDKEEESRLQQESSPFNNHNGRSSSSSSSSGDGGGGGGGGGDTKSNNNVRTLSGHRAREILAVRSPFGSDKYGNNSNEELSQPMTPSARLSKDYASPDVSPPRALFAQEYDSLKELFNQCGFEATDGFLQHVQQQQSMSIASSNDASQPADRRRLNSITAAAVSNGKGNHANGSFNTFMSQESPRPDVRQFASATSSPNKQGMPQNSSLSPSAPTTATSGGGNSFSLAMPTRLDLASSSDASALLSHTTDLSTFAMESKSQKFRKWGQHVVPGSDDDKTAMDRVRDAAAVHLRPNVQVVREVSAAPQLLVPGIAELLHSTTGGEIGDTTSTLNNSSTMSNRRPDFFMDIELPSHGASNDNKIVQLPVYMNVAPKNLARDFVQKYKLKKRRIPKLTDDIDTKMKVHRETSKRKRFALHLQRRRNFLARWKSAESESVQENTTPSLMSHTSLSTSSESKRANRNDTTRQPSSRNRQSRKTNQTTVIRKNKNPIRPVVGKLHVHIAADSKKTIIIRKGDTADELAGRFSHRYGLKRRDAELVKERIGRQIYASQREEYGIATSSLSPSSSSAAAARARAGAAGAATVAPDKYGNLYGPFSPSPEKNIARQRRQQEVSATSSTEFPSNLTPSQRRLLMMTLGKGVELQTPWQTPSAASSSSASSSFHATHKHKSSTKSSSSRSSKAARRKTPILRMQIEIAGTPSSLTVHEGDNVRTIARKFVQDHSLPLSSVETISQVIDNAVLEEKKRTRVKHGGNIRR